MTSGALTGASTDARYSPWVAWYRRALPSYWLFLFIVTHLPRLSLPSIVPQPDRLAHVTAYGLLTFLLWRFWETFRPLRRRAVWTIVVILLTYGAADEYLQQFVGRATDWRDWLADAVGVFLVAALLDGFGERRQR